MSQGFGHQSWIGFGVESTWGTAVARTKFYEFNSESIAFDEGLAPKPTVRGVDVSANRTVRKPKSVDGSFDVQVSYSNMEVLFKHALGTNNTTGAGPYTHAITLATALPTGLSIEVNRDAANVGAGSSWLYEGCQIDSMKLSHEIGDVLMASFEIVGEDSSNTTISTPSFATFDGIQWDELAVTLNGVEIEITGYELTLNNKLAKDRRRLGLRTRKGLGRGESREVTGVLKMEYDSKTTSDFYRTYSESFIGILLFTYTSGSKTLTISVPGVVFEGKDPSVDNAGPIAIELPFRGYGLISDNTSMSMTFVNSVTSVP